MFAQVKKFIDDCRSNKHGALLRAVGQIAYDTKNKLGLRSQITARRLQLSNDINARFDGTVRYGPFKGLKFSDKSWWGETDRANMLLGLYEQEVLHSIQDVPEKYDTFIDIGAANGYYGVGVLVAGLFAKSYCYEISVKGQETIMANAELNNVSDRIIVRGIANPDFFKDIPQEALGRSLLFVDIEGGEFELLDEALLEKFKDSILLIEAHPWAIEGGEAKLTKLKDTALKFFTIQELTTTSRDLSAFDELKDMDDTDRWLICSEGRPCRMTWLRLDPRSSENH